MNAVQINATQTKSPWQMKIFPIFTALGWILILVSFLIGAFVLAPTAASYWGGSAKVVRDAAEAGSTLVAQLGVQAATPRWLEPLAFLGVAFFMTGIALEFSTIPGFLKTRGQILKNAFPLVVNLGK